MDEFRQSFKWGNKLHRPNYRRFFVFVFKLQWNKDSEVEQRSERNVFEPTTTQKTPAQTSSGRLWERDGVRASHPSSLDGSCVPVVVSADCRPR